MRYSYINPKGQQSINSSVVFCDCLKSQNPLDFISFKDFLKECEEQVKREFSPTFGALANVRGNWYEWLISVGYFWYQREYLEGDKFVFIPIPNISRLDLYSLYKDEIYKFIYDLRGKTEKVGVSLISSNPDFVLIEKELYGEIPNLQNFDEYQLVKVVEFYKSYIGKCDFSEIIAFASVKTSLRPDRRLQLSHEGALTKAFYQHLKTRLWLTNVSALQYFACSIEVGQKDIKALKTVATHSILSVDSVPEPAVDLLREVSNGKELKSFFDAIFTKKPLN